MYSETGDLGGSGTLVAAGNARAILTASNVLDAQPERGQVGLILPSRLQAQLHRFVIQMETVQTVIIGQG